MKVSAQETISVVMVAIGGYGYYYLKTLWEEFPSDAINLKAVVDPTPRMSDHFPTIQRIGIPIFTSLEEFYKSGGTADLAVIASPVQYHTDQSCTALRHGSHVLCDKPAAATTQDVDRMIVEKNRSGCWMMIGYQWSYSKAIQDLKHDILKGTFGKPLRLKTLYLWPRDESYYRRNDWAGKMKDDEGRWVLDSPAQSAMAHDLHNMFYLLGGAIDRSALPIEVMAEAYRVNPIENYDTVACRIITEVNVELLFYASHAVPEKIGPLFSFEFEEAAITYRDFQEGIVARDKRGHEKKYGSPDANHQFKKLFDAVDCAKEFQTILCGPEAARSQVLCVNGIQELVSEIGTFPDSMIRYDEKERLHWVEGLSEVFGDCYRKAVLPSEAGVSRALRGRKTDLRNYQYYPGGVLP
jgi:predicted dehydrogenase